MRLVKLLCILAFILPLKLLGETMDVNIGDPRVESDSFKFEIQIKRTDAWDIGFGKNGGLGNCDFYFNNNSLAFTGDPTLSSVHPEITTHPQDFDLIVQINGGQLQVKLTYTPTTVAWNPTLDVYEDLCTVQWKIGNPALSSGVSWDETNSGFNDGDKNIIHPVYLGTGNISLPVILTTSISQDFPKSFKLHQNYPNPFNPSTRILFDVPRVKKDQLRISLVIYNALGQVVRELYAGDISPGSFEVKWEGRTNAGTPVPSGIYFAIFRGENYQETIRLLLLK